MYLYSFSYSETLPHEKKMADFGQDICNTHGYKCTHLNRRNFFLYIMILLFLAIDLEGGHKEI